MIQKIYFLSGIAVGVAGVLLAKTLKEKICSLTLEQVVADASAKIEELKTNCSSMAEGLKPKINNAVGMIKDEIRQKKESLFPTEAETQEQTMVVPRHVEAASNSKNRRKGS